jgi:hypothetical protein
MPTLRKPEADVPVKYDMILAIRRIKGGTFSGLFQVVELDGRGMVKRIITDANSKGIALDLMCNAAYKI